MNVVVTGQLARDLVLLVDEMPETGTSADARLRREMLGGKGANQAVALAQLGARPVLVAVRGDDRVGEELIEQARRDGIDVGHVICRPGTETGLIVEALDASGGWRYLQHLPDGVLLTEADVDAAAPTLRSADAVLVQLQQPGPAALAAARHARAGGALVVLDGELPEAERDELLKLADVIRADEHEAESLGDVSVEAPGGTGAETLGGTGGPLLMLGRSDGNLVRWADGEEFIPLTDEKVVDTTGAGDALTAALTVGLLRGMPPVEAGRFAVAAAGATVGHPGGRPDLSRLRRG
ncbi:putative PfkB-family carbohydrate kinase [Actinoplanes missouriensis 431]|uniref:Putative PfkB-family carbohydrate kinase n=1 Tax=Actinoplanes missouriensis (strain ATCC 14538 / DSM 43046 / CBS 188.64 / JCM 3121 / NBRC 102363 / NCIMB 12654 / NRRL B-3342 / UNCC 431) TaxID=512565 RepID=I0HDC3_ACTM4|nr:PfkB family carbohydrate kinase [Actinoplanes missouriensis]BAL91010.1 putative PfkB-family carbohydrate kinase [Actinoplanes missouriensis 431]